MGFQLDIGIGTSHAFLAKTKKFKWKLFPKCTRRNVLLGQGKSQTIFTASEKVVTSQDIPKFIDANEPCCFFSVYWFHTISILLLEISFRHISAESGALFR
jgi:hypothetical protein